MTRQLEQIQEERETKRREALVRALEFELPGVLETQGIILTGFAVKYDAYECLMTVKVIIGGERHVGFVGGASIIDCVLRAVEMGRNSRLRWKVDKYNPSVT